jgi:hypothetical protein
MDRTTPGVLLVCAAVVPIACAMFGVWAALCWATGF